MPSPFYNSPIESVPMVFYVVYKNPSDYPDKFVVRKHVVIGGMARTGVAVQPSAVVEALELARSAIPAGLVNIGRDPGDDPAIVEVWV